MCLVRFFSLIISLSLAVSAYGSDDLFIGSKTDKPASIWQEGMLTGNGIMGAIMFGNPICEEIVFTHNELYLPLGTKEIVPDLRTCFDELKKKALDSGNMAPSVFHAEILKKTGKTISWTDPFHPGFSLQIKDSLRGREYTDYEMSENFSTGELAVSWTDKYGEKWNRRLFISRKDSVGVMEINGPKGKVGGTFSLSLGHDLVSVKKSAFNNELRAHVVYDKGKGGYENVVRIIPLGGRLEVKGNDIEVHNSDKILLFIQIRPWKSPLSKESSEAWAYNPSNPDFSSNTNSDKLTDIHNCMDRLQTDYKELLKAHSLLHSELFGRVELSLGNDDKGRSEINTLKLLQMCRNDRQASPEFISYLYDACRYLIVCSTNNKPANLQGLWTGTWNPEWSGDYTLDSNIQLEIQSLMSCNMPELMEGYFKLIESWVEDCRTNALKMYNCRGIVSNPRASNTPLYLHWGNWPGELAIGTMGWMLHFFYDYYLFTGDKSFLRDRVVPLLKESALFYEDLLAGTEDENGKYRFFISYSPEQDDLLYMNSTFDVAVAKNVLTNLIKSSRILGIESDNIPKWEMMLKKMPEYKINTSGVLSEWTVEGVRENPNHRHHSHLLPLYQFCEFDRSDTIMWNASCKAFEEKVLHWLNNNDNPNSNHITHGLMNQLQCAARLGRGDIIQYVFDLLVSGNYIYPNFMISYWPGLRGFGFDPVGTIPDVINNSLIFSWNDKIDILPALPKTWRRGSLSNILLRGAVKVDKFSWDLDKGEIFLVLYSDTDKDVEFILPDKYFVFSVDSNQSGNKIKLFKGKNQFRFKQIKS